MKKYLLLILCLFFNVSLFSQQIKWSKIYNFQPSFDNLSFTFVENADSGFMIAGWYRTSGNGSAFVLRVDKYGDTIWTRKYFNLVGNSGIATIESIKDSLYICYGGFVYPGESDCSIGVINSNGDTLLHRTYGNPLNADEPLRLSKCFDGGFIMCTDGFGANDIIKIDSNYNFEWSRNSYMSQCISIIQDIDSGFIAVGNSGLGVKKYGILKIDKNGNDVWYQPQGNMPLSSDPYYANDIVVAPDSNYIICSDGTDWQMMKVNRNTGDTIWTKSYPVSIYGFNSRELGSIDYAGNNTFITSYFSHFHGVMLINGNDGDTIWTKRNPLFYIIYEVRKTSDGGFAFCGSEDIIPYRSCFVKLDSLGNTQYTAVFDNATSQILNIYPNPSTDIIYINNNSFINEKNVEVCISNLQGKILLQQVFKNNDAIDVSSLNDGLYVATLSNANKQWRGKFLVQH